MSCKINERTTRCSKKGTIDGHKCELVNNRCKKKVSKKKKKPIKCKDAKNYLKKDAKITDDYKYRYSLTRIWDNSKEKLLFIMLNPSTADYRTDDRTIQKIVRFADSWGYGGIYVGNLYAFRSTDPKIMFRLPMEERKGPENEKYLRDLISKTEKVVYAWGNGESEPEWLKSLVKKPYVIELSKYGIPKHPLYLRKDSTLKLYRK